MTDIEIQREIEGIYREVPELKCKELCQECCGPIAMTKLEFSRIRERTAEPINARLMPLVFGNGQNLGRAVLFDCVTCPLLKDGRCSIYDIRPLICRIWGAVQAMRCPHGCTPKRWLSPRESFRLLSRARALSEKIERRNPAIADIVGGFSGT